MATEKILIFDEAGNAKRMKVRIARFLDNEPVTSSDKENIRETLGVDDSLSGDFTTDITTTAQIGAGTATPSSTASRYLTVGDASGQSDILINSGNANFGQLIFGDSDAEFRGSISYSHSADEFQIYTAGSKRATIDSGGNLILQKGGGAYLQLKDATAVRGSINVGTSDGLIFTTGASFAERLRIDGATGKIGIGTSATPDTKLHIKGENGNQLKLDNSGEQWTQTNFANNGTTKTFVALDHTDHKFIIGANGSYSDLDYIGFRPDGTNDDLVVKRDGKVGIQTTAPDAGVHFKKASGETIFKAEVGGNSTVGFEIKKTGSTTQGWRIVDGQTVNGTLEFYDVTNSATRWSINSSGNLIGNGGGQILYNDGDCLFVGDSGNLNWDRSASSLILGAGAGIDFSSGGASSVMDDYERGTATPTDASGAGLTLAGVGCNYVKIGSQVTVWVTVTYPTTSDTSSASVGSFPFAFGSSNIDRIGGVAAYSTYAGTLTALGVTGTGRVHFIHEGVTLTNANLSGKVIWFSVTYDVS